MAAAIEKKLITEQEYLEEERNASYKSEFYKGEVFAMSGASRIHNVISGNLFGFLLRLVFIVNMSENDDYY